ncbi:hypothetical protein DKX38_000400 [Salix brachista]|uniref:Uncharacterized protein n=1 Tax=Salix brachista TaxID=2182728 RepID=A0A5N5P376_9ROSI|nr:hypothetical protein DKX38_000400 [Salix brachista]
MLSNNAEQLMLNVDSKDLLDRKLEDSPSVSVSISPTQNTRPSSMVVKASPSDLLYGFLSYINSVIAEAIPTIHGLDLRWSGPITQSEMQYVFDNLCKNEESSRTTPDSKPGYPKRLGAGEPTPFIHSRLLFKAISFQSQKFKRKIEP